MKKLRLDELQVESFATTDAARGRGTVDGMQVTGAESACGPYCMTREYRLSCAGGECTDPGGGGGGGTETMNGVTCNVTCAKGETDCGTCYPDASCDLQYGCGGTSYDMQIC